MLSFIKRLLNLTYYISPLDQFLASYQEKRSHRSASERAEKEKHQRIAALRDTEKATAQSNPFFWSAF